MTDSLHSHNSKYREGLRSGRRRSLLAKMAKSKAKKRRVNRVKGFASRGRGKKCILILIVVLLLIPAMQVAVVRFINPSLTLPMLIEQGGATFSKAPKPPLLYRWIDLPQIPEMFLKHLWISEDQRFFRVKGFASRGLIIIFSLGVLCVRVAIGERLRFLHWLLNQPARPIEAASRGRELRYVSPRSLETYLLRGVLEPGRCSRTRKVS